MSPSLGGRGRGGKESGGANKIHTSQFKAPSSGSPTMQRLLLSLSLSLALSLSLSYALHI